MTLRPAFDTEGTMGVGGGEGRNLTVLDPSILLVILLYSNLFHSTVMNIVTKFDSMNGPYNHR